MVTNALGRYLIIFLTYRFLIQIMKKHHFSLLYSLVISLVVIVSPIISATNQTDSTSNQDLSLTQKEGLKVNLMNINYQLH